jgi:hypothetical protein
VKHRVPPFLALTTKLDDDPVLSQKASLEFLQNIAEIHSLNLPG